MNPGSSTKDLKILHIASGDRWAGAEVMVYTLLKELHKNHDVFAIILNHGELAKRLEQINIPVTILDESKQGTWQLLRGMVKTLKAIKPHIVHTHRQKENILGSIANSISIKAKSLRTIHGDSEIKPVGFGKVQVFLDDLCGRFLQHAIIAVSDDLRQKLIARFPEERLITIQNGIDPDETRNNLETPDFKQTLPHHKHIGIVGRLDPVKRIDIFLEMAAILKKEHPEVPWQFHIFGEGQLEVELRNLSKRLELTSHVTFHGHRMDIKNCIHGLDAIVMCSDHEGLPMTALESVVIGTPLIAHKVGGLVEVLKSSPHLLVSKHTPVKYSNKVLEVITDDIGMTNLPECYHIERTALQVYESYTSIVLG